MGWLKDTTLLPHHVMLSDIRVKDSVNSVNISRVQDLITHDCGIFFPISFCSILDVVPTLSNTDASSPKAQRAGEIELAWLCLAGTLSSGG